MTPTIHTVATTVASVTSLPLAQLVLSDTGAQAERRKRFDPAAIAELAASLRTVGQLSPLVVRPEPGGTYRIVAGERRFLAAKQAGLAEVAVTVRELTDAQVLEVQLIENLQREGLHELVEAEGYEQLMKLGKYSADDLATKVGKSRGYVYARLKLLALCPAGRKAFHDGEISASVALLVARIPTPMQPAALKEISKGWGGPMSYRQACEHVQRHYMTRLAEAGFPTSDPELVPAAGACGACPKRTGNQPELFGDVKGADVCTDPVCFRGKREAWAARRIEQARASGQTVIEGAAAKKIAPYGATSLLVAYKRLDDRVYDDPKNRTVAQLLGKGAETILVKIAGDKDEASAVIEVVPEQAIRAALKEKGVKASRELSTNPDAAREKKAKRERAVRQAIAEAVLAKLPTDLGDRELLDVATGYWTEIQNDTQKAIAKLLGWETLEKKGWNGNKVADLYATAKKEISKADGAGLARILLAFVIARDTQVFTWSDSKPELLLRMAQRYRVDAEKIRRDLAAADKAKVAKKPAKKAATAKRGKAS